MVHYIHEYWTGTDRHGCILLVYIVLPSIVQTGMIDSNDGEYKYTTYSICSSSVINPVPEPTLEQTQLFKTVLKRLYLQPMHYNLSKDLELKDRLETPGK